MNAALDNGPVAAPVNQSQIPHSGIGTPASDDVPDPLHDVSRGDLVPATFEDGAITQALEVCVRRGEGSC